MPILKKNSTNGKIKFMESKNNLQARLYIILESIYNLSFLSGTVYTYHL